MRHRVSHFVLSYEFHNVEHFVRVFLILDRQPLLELPLFYVLGQRFLQVAELFVHELHSPIALCEVLVEQEIPIFSAGVQGGFLAHHLFRLSVEALHFDFAFDAESTIDVLYHIH